MWVTVEIIGKEDIGGRGFRVHVSYASDDKETFPLDSQVDIPPGVDVLQFFDMAVKAKLSELNNPSLKTAFDSLAIGVYTVTTNA